MVSSWSGRVVPWTRIGTIYMLHSLHHKNPGRIHGWHSWFFTRAHKYAWIFHQRSLYQLSLGYCRSPHQTISSSRILTHKYRKTTSTKATGRNIQATKKPNQTSKKLSTKDEGGSDYKRGGGIHPKHTQIRGWKFLLTYQPQHTQQGWYQEQNHQP